MTKKKFVRQFHNNFPWFDHENLIEVMILWIENASKMHHKYSDLVRSESTAKKLKIIAELLKRIRKDEYDTPCKVFTKRNKTSGCGYVYINYKHQYKQRKQDKEYVFKLLAKHLDTFWD
tara:strand:- start:6530 stop:6886 length:357 start_codon:yes stop_codon:yes gene_type:complete